MLDIYLAFFLLYVQKNKSFAIFEIFYIVLSNRFPVMAAVNAYGMDNAIQMVLCITNIALIMGHPSL